MPSPWGEGGGGMHNVLAFVFRILTEAWLFTLQSPVREPFCRSRQMSSHFKDVATPLSLGPLFHWCLLVLLNVSSRMSSLCGFLAQPCLCLVSDNTVPHAAQEWQCESSLCMWWPTSSRTYHCPRPFSSPIGGTIHLNFSPHATSSVLWQVSLQCFL
jgi:hypothetical protein